jgi:pSer/pThr/pTyr-binding forkhead associated (FHA) protein
MCFQGAATSVPRRERRPEDGHSEATTARALARPGQEKLTTTGKLISITPALLAVDEVREFWLTRSEETLGAGSECSVQIRSSELAQLHARVTAFSNQWLIENCSNGPGTWINDIPVESRSKLSGGDVLRLGGASFRFEVLNVSPSEFAEVPKAATVSEERKIQSVQTLQLELSADGKLVDVSPGRTPTAAQKLPVSDKAQPAVGQSGKPVKVMAETNSANVQASGNDNAGRALELVLLELDKDLPQLLQMLLAHARKGNVEAACACLNFAAGERRGKTLSD